MKIILVLLDGLGDRSYAELNCRTPLEAANTPNMDRLAAMGATGLFHASSPGECLPSEMAHFLIFGYDRRNFPGRGLLEAVGENVPFKDPDVLALAHFSGVRIEDNRFVLAHGRDAVSGTKADLSTFFKTVETYETAGIHFRLQQTRRNDGIIVISGDVSPFISDSDPITPGMAIGRVLPLQDNPEPVRAKKTADALNQYLLYCHKTLSADPKLGKKANMLVTQRCGRRNFQKPFAEIWGLAPVMIASGTLYHGLAQELGFDVMMAKDSDSPGKDLAERIQMALDDPVHEFFHVHTKVPDEISHKGTPELKKQALAELDTGLKDLVTVLGKQKDMVVIVTGDHSTPSDSRLIHSGEPVPVAIAGPNIRRDRVTAFDEISTASGCMGMLRGRELLQMALNFADRSSLVTHQLGDTVRPFIPDDYPPLLPS